MLFVCCVCVCVCPEIFGPPFQIMHRKKWLMVFCIIKENLERNMYMYMANGILHYQRKS